MKIVSLICNTVTISLCIYLLYNLWQDIKTSKSSSQLRKIPLLKWSMALIMCFFVNVLPLVFVPFWPQGYAICDFIMQFIILVTVLVYFKHWETNFNLFIKNRFILMLEVKTAANRLTFMARVMTRASKCLPIKFLSCLFYIEQIMRNTDDEPSADEFVTSCRKICD